MASDVDKIKEKLDLVDVIQSYIELNKAGKNFKGLCPFHDEEDPSFVVSPTRQIWHCFGCGKGGDLIEFVKMYEGMEFPEALRFLAKKADISLDNISNKAQKKLGELYKINEEAKNFYKQKLQDNENVKKYLKSRGLTQETIEEFELGFAPGEDSLTVHLLDKGFDIKDIVKSGLAYKKSGGMHKDKFQRRLVFPIINEIEKTVAFTGRISPRKEKEGADIPKYINSPETPVYKKSKVFYGLYKSKPHIVDSETVFIVEGQMDFLMVWQAGVKNLVATSGTGLTQKHLEKLKRLADTVILCFDNDSGGLRALERALELFGEYDFHVKTLDLGDYTDPAEAVQDDPEFFEKKYENARAAFDYLFEHYFEKKNIEDIPEQKKVVRHLLKKISALDSAIEQDTWLKKLAEYSGISAPRLEVELEKIEREGSNTRKFKRDEDPEEEVNLFPTKNRRARIAKRLIERAFTDDELWSIVKTNSKWFPKDFKEVIEDPDSRKAAYLEMKSSFDLEDESMEDVKREMADLLNQLKIEGLEMKKRAIRSKMRRSDDEKKGLASQMHEIAQRIEKIKQTRPTID